MEKNAFQISILKQQLTDSRNYLNNILTLLPGHIYWMDKEGKIIGCNEQQAQSFGLPSSEKLIGMNIYDVAKLLKWDKKIPDEIHQNDIKVMTAGEPILIEEKVILKGKEKTFLSRKSPLRDAKNQIIGIIGIATDITELKEMQEKNACLEKEKTILKTKMISFLASSIVHEVGNLLGGVIVNYQLLELHLRTKVNLLTDEEKHPTLELLQTLKQNLENAKLMFESIKLNIRSGEINKEQFELANIADDIAAILTICFPGEESVATIKWNQQEQFDYFGIPAYTRNILINLIKNALYFIKEQGKGKIMLTLKKGAKFNQLIVEDTAQGIPKELLPKIFSQFSTTRKGGMGMGLAFCKRVMENYGGDIICESEFGHYTKFILTFPTIVIE